MGKTENNPLFVNLVEILDEIVPTTKSLEVQTVNSYTNFFSEKRNKDVITKVEKKENKVYNQLELMNDLKSKG